jgi:protein translocase SEC61 complex gamma subunit
MIGDKMQESFWSRFSYVMNVSTKPTREEIVENFKITLLGVALMGVIGYAISLIFGLFGVMGG